jgi:Spy/CpxP family protein refolding chaperone
MKRTLIAVAVAGALSLGTMGLYAQEHGKGGRHGFMHKGMALEHLTKDLDLTPEQQAKVAPIVDQARPQIMAIHQEAMEKTRAVMENAATQIRPLLTPQQQQKFDALKKAHEDMLNAMREMHQAKMQ